MKKEEKEAKEKSSFGKVKLFFLRIGRIEKEKEAKEKSSFGKAFLFKKRFEVRRNGG
ncbi:MAG: hypothetical protein QMD80_06510 [archaeon]|nr:hypothetical protein [archaeon]